jgi:peptide/nickel transport system substrate-binding protein
MSAPSASPLSRRSFLSASAAALAATGLAACSTGGTIARDSAGGGTLTFATDVEPDIYDPHVSAADITGALLRNVFDSLVAEADDGTFRPWLAKSWKVSADGTAYTFELRTDVVFTDGTPFDANAVKANFDHIVAPATKSQFAVQLIGPYAGTDVLAPHTARVRLTRPYSSFLHAASTSYLGFYSPKVLTAHAGELADGHYAVGTGPFTLASRTKGQRVVFRRNPAYRWGAPTDRGTGPAGLAQLTVEFLTEDATRVGAVSSGQIDVADDLPANRVKALTAQSGLSILQQDSPGIVYSYYLNTSRAPFDQLDARLAVQHAVDTGAITRGIFAGQYQRAYSPLSPSTVGYDPSLKGSWEYDPARAEKLLDGLGWTGRDGKGYRTRAGRRFSLTLLYVPAYSKAERLTFNTAVQDDLRKVGIELRLVPMDPGSYAPRRNKGDYDVIAFAWGGSDPGLLRTVFHSRSQFTDGGANGSWVKDPRIDGWLDAADRTTATAARNALYAKVQQRIVEQAYSVPAFVGLRQLAVRARAKGLAFDASAWPLFHDARVDA